MSTLIRWSRRDPFAEFDSLVRAAFGPTAPRPSGSVPAARPRAFTPAAEVVRNGQDALVRVEVPGVDVERDISVEITGGQLVVRGERRDEREDKREGRVLREVRYGSFRRSFSLPDHVTDENVTATYDQGVLTVRVAGAYAERSARRIAVTAGPDTPESHTEQSPAGESAPEAAVSQEQAAEGQAA